MMTNMDGISTEDIVWFPQNLEKHRGIPINSHPGAFGCARKFNYHEGVDLYGDKGDYVYAIKSGIVVANKQFTGPEVGCPWWLSTDALLIQDNSGFFVYGELKSPLKIGDKVSRGTKIGELTPVLPESKHRPDIPEHSVTMLHLERYNNTYSVDMGWSSWYSHNTRPPYLEDPTLFLINTLLARKKEVKLLVL
jgi:hypothetical protein